MNNVSTETHRAATRKEPMRPTRGVLKFKDLPNYPTNSKKDKERK